MTTVPRTDYLAQLNMWRDKQVVKIITGIRRCGKSTLMAQFREELKRSGVGDEQILYLNFEDIANEPLTDYKALYSYITERLTEGKQNYIFLDEIQMVESFQRAVDSLTLRPNVDIYITGSNARLLSGEIATLLSGRYIELQMLPFSFSEYSSAQQLLPELVYRRYISETSFPYGLQLTNQDMVREYIQGVYSTVILKDIIARRKLQDMDLLERLIRFLSDNIGNMVSIRTISTNLAVGERKVSEHTVESYLQALTECYLFYKVGRYDIRGRQNLKVGYKYYICDFGFRNLLLGIRNNDLGHILENVVYLELLRRGYQVMIGKMDSAEIDFITFKSGQTAYYQVALSVRNEATLQRELKPLLQIADHYPKYLITMDADPIVSHNGIQQIYALDWLTNEGDK